MGQNNLLKTMFVLGAGSSHGLGFPLGNELKRELLTHLKPGNLIFEAVASSGYTPEKVAKFAKRLARAEFDTIDDHLRAISDAESRDIGQLAVAYLIRTQENEDRLFHTDENMKHWYKAFTNHLNKHKEQASPEFFSFISYNYDRSLQFYLFEALQARNVSDQSLKFFLGGLNFHSVHGSVGMLPWQLQDNEPVLPYHHYGETMNIANLAAHKPKIQHPDDEHDVGLMPARLVGNAQVVVFIGFGFHQSNLRQLPFNANSSEGSVQRHYYSINPLPPPADITFGGQPVIHINGRAEDAMKLFFTELESGELLKRGTEPKRPISGHLGRKVVRVIR